MTHSHHLNLWTRASPLQSTLPDYISSRSKYSHVVIAVSQASCSGSTRFESYPGLHLY